MSDIREELQFHIEKLTEENIRAGMTPEEARRAAIDAFGAVNTIEEQCKENRRGAALESFVEDARIGLRLIGRSPSFAFAVIATLAVAIAACATMFSIVDAVLLRPIGFPDPARLFSIYETPANAIEYRAFSPPNFIDLDEQSRGFAAMAAYNTSSYNLAGRETESVQGVQATSDLFRTLGVQPAHGRAFVAGERNVVVIAHGLAVRQFGSAEAAVNRTLLLDSKPRTVVGVMPPGFRFPDDEKEIWAPLNWRPDIHTQRGAHYLRVIGRVASNVSPAEATREVRVIGARLAAAYPDTNEGTTFTAQRHDAALVRDVRRGLLILLAAVIVLALIASANVANLLLARAATRAREWSMRSALGASRFRVMRQFLTESLMFGLFGGAGGLALTWIGVRLLVRFAPDDIPRLADATLSGRVLLVTILAALAMSVLFGILPAISASRAADLNGIRGGGRIAGARGASRLRATMAVAQLALAVTLLAGAGLLVRSFLRVLAVDPGFDARNVLTFEISLPLTYDGTERVNSFHDSLLDRLRAKPGIDAAGVTSHLPIDGGRFSGSFRMNGVENDDWSASVYVADEGYFQALRVPLVRGRRFDGSERLNGQRVVLVSASAAKRFWPERDPIGTHVRFGARAGYERYEGEIIGIVGDVHQHGQEEEIEPTFYFPLRQAGIDFATYVVKSSIDPAALIESIRAEVSAVDRTVAVSRIATMEDHLSDSTARRRFQVFLLSFFAAAAMLLASLGVYGVIAYSVTQRTREIGVRVALGSSVAGVFRMILGEAMRLVVPAILAGLGVALALHRVIATMLFRVSPTDAATLTGVGLIVAAVSLLAACIPARRAAAVDPIVALRYE